MQINPFNAWFLAAPLFIVGIYIALRHRDTAKRMADMTGYTRKEKAVAVSASSIPHLFMVLAIFIPLSLNITAVAIGAPLYVIGLPGFIAAVAGYIKAPPDAPAMHGIYRISRNPMYVFALLAYAGITFLTLNILLAILLIIMIVLHHMMILAEEKACVRRFGKQYEQYREKTPRYLFL